ncbi:hypothetical protein [Mobilicoccus massiliensis]|uniref:hypothetical protein n=1 Tax=Mobilicoccus massiliensis TaxID=1522310 RepID=UPI00058CA2F2|nr:hypothetical protein [Mobilicoccus massiliensis]
MKNTLRTLAATLAASGVALSGGVAATADTTPGATAKHDLGVHYTVSTAKLDGHPGLVAIRLDNAGTDRYFAEFPLVTFDVLVKTVKGPEGVNRNLNARGLNGAHVEDLGFDEATSTRAYRIVLSNPVEKGAKNLPIASFDFGVGATKEGRIFQKIVTTQKGRVSGDTPNANDQGVDSTVAGNTRDDFGKVGTVTGLF